jgi:hypothetical protein
MGVYEAALFSSAVLKHPQSTSCVLPLRWTPGFIRQHGLKVFENRVLRRIFGPKRDEVEEGWRRLHNEKLRNLYASSNIIRAIKSRRMKLAAHVARMEQMTNACNILVGKPEPLGRRRRILEDNI